MRRVWPLRLRVPTFPGSLIDEVLNPSQRDWKLERMAAG
jgi:hypothetical protein